MGEPKNRTAWLGKLKEKLPEHPGIHAKEEEFVNTAVMVLLVYLEGEYHFVFQKRNANIRQGGEISFPGGVRNPETDPTYEDTAVRETVEEMGIHPDKLKIVGRLDTFISPMGATIDAVVGVAEIESLEEIKLNKSEVDYFFTIPVSFFIKNKPEQYQVGVTFSTKGRDQTTGEEIELLPVKKLGLPDHYAQPWRGQRFKVYVYHTDKEIIWGLTARFVRDFVKKIDSF